MTRVRSWKRLAVPQVLLLPMILVYTLVSYYPLQGDMRVTGFLTLMATASLFQAALNHPGKVQDGLNELPAGEGEGFTTYCHQCEVHRPLRAHHCSKCNECILRYDHHCDWIDNCVGRRNYKAFVLFLIYTIAGIVHYCALAGSFVTHPQESVALQQLRQSFKWSAFLLIVITIFALVVTPLGIVAVAFLVASILRAARNDTAYDDAYGSLGMYSSSGGIYSNLRETFGSNVLLWPFPTMVD